MRVDVPVVDAHHARRVAVVGGGSQRPPELRPADEELQADEHGDRDPERQQRQDPDGEAAR